MNAAYFLESCLSEFNEYLMSYEPAKGNVLLNPEEININAFRSALSENINSLLAKYKIHPELFSTKGNDGKMKYQVERGLDIAIGEYAPGRAVVVDKHTYQIGGIYYLGNEWKKAPARSFIEAPSYLKDILLCRKCEWFGLADDSIKTCPFCGSGELSLSRQMLRPWKFAPVNAEPVSEAQLSEEYTHVQTPLYSTLPESDG